jgi:hypothetical protein
MHLTLFFTRLTPDENWLQSAPPRLSGKIDCQEGTVKRNANGKGRCFSESRNCLSWRRDLPFGTLSRAPDDSSLTSTESYIGARLKPRGHHRSESVDKRPHRNPEFLTARELETSLKIDVKTICSNVQRGLIPYLRIQSNVRFGGAQIVGWICRAQLSKLPCPSAMFQGRASTGRASPIGLPVRGAKSLNVNYSNSLLVRDA